ncbi:uncharacterized protein N7483_006015 [Penicillium malachiteum]|uniref:uncharacterized protein n=1 Tax=Penicillium malachiteum TaxID=1324776 RepID=UPI00254850F0|nr:uncharacterized protein N7483_006015 [Penicillium malachiteum]KAJ5731507.1 hypothetical protein N7483_006015 [Penicillium malachiteum]
MQNQTIAILENGGIPVVSIPHLLSGMDTKQTRIYFWLDTLCVPVPPANLPDEEKRPWERSRKQSISRMREAYLNARFTRVLDAELMMTPIPSSNSEQAREIEYFTRVLISTWNFRMWTFSEACLNIFYVQFKDEIFAPFEALLKFAEDKDFLEIFLKHRETPMMYPGFHKRSQMSETGDDDDKIDHLVYCWTGICWRTTSKPKDQVICVCPSGIEYHADTQI